MHELKTEGLERVLAFSDGVFAIAITLLILDIRLPNIETAMGNEQLLAALLELWPKFFAYLISFFVVAIFWIKHHVTFRAIKAYDARLLWLNMLLLLVVSFIPFPTSVMSAQHNAVATVFYALTMAAGFAMSGWIWWHATRGGRLLKDDVDPQVGRAALASSLVAGGVFLLSAVVALLIDAHWGRLCLLLIVPATNATLWRWVGERPG